MKADQRHVHQKLNFTVKEFTSLFEDQEVFQMHPSRMTSETVVLLRFRWVLSSLKPNRCPEEANLVLVTQWYSREFTFTVLKNIYLLHF